MLFPIFLTFAFATQSPMQSPNTAPGNPSVTNESSDAGMVGTTELGKPGTGLSDRALAGHIQQELMNRNLNQNNKIFVVARNGIVTLDGHVESQDERKAVEDIANTIAGRHKVQNKISIERGFFR